LDAKQATLTTLTITDAAVAMISNRRYQGSIAAFTADRNYTLPAGTAGDVIEIQITTGDDLYELILVGATGVSINGGSAATEWSRLFISNEVVRFYCAATNDWRVIFDGRIAQHCEMFLTTTVASHYVNAAYTKVPVDTIAIDNASIGSLANDTITPRRAGKYDVQVKARNFASTGINAVRLSVGGVTELIHIETSSASGQCVTLSRKLPSVAANAVIFADNFQNGGSDRDAIGSATDEPNLIALLEVF
jgi:hypothetical protein